MTRLSPRARRLLAGTSPLVSAHMRAMADPYHATRNPAGYVNLGTAENHLVWDLLVPALRGPRSRVASDVSYHQLYGMPSFRRAIADFLGREHATPVEADDLVVVSGASAALDILAYTLCQPGDGIVVPAPYYSGFNIDLAGRAEARLVPATLSGDRDFRFDQTALESAIVRARRDGVPLRAIAVTSPGNPVGHTLDPAALDGVARLAARHSLDVIADEIYGCSVFGSDGFHTALAMGSEVLPGERIHVVWGFAKDFGLSGLKVGVLHTRDRQVRAAARELAYLAPVSTDTQLLLRDLLSDHGWVRGFLTEYRARLRAAYHDTVTVLHREGVGHISVDGGLFLWLDLRDRLDEPTADAEQTLWRRLFEEYRVSITPGSAFQAGEPGWFRLCYATDPAAVREGAARIGEALRSGGGTAAR